jgi:MoaA/NifB/PqqE/SkfB family radical SAM enzyme
MTYAELARKMGVSFIQLLEPRATGHYSGREVGLNEVQLKMLDHFYHQMNFTRKYREYPIICYHGHYQRKVGCFGAGNRSVYVDTDGDFHACPFCRSKMGSVLTDDFEQKLAGLMEAGCHKFERSLF